jgi:shikimate kinase
MGQPEIEPVPEGFDLHPHRVDIVLLGQDTASTTDVGFRLARQLRRPFVSCHSLFVAHHDRTPREVFEEEGLDALRRLQRRLAGIAMTSRSSIVFAGCSNMLSDDATEFSDIFGDAWVVWLDASPEVLARRIDDDERWRFGDDPLAELQRDDERIRRFLDEAVDLHLDTDHLSPEAQVAVVAATWERRRRDHVLAADRPRAD